MRSLPFFLILDENSLSKLASYSTLASSFLLYSPQINAQCGTANSFNPVLGIDIDGDGNSDLSLNWNMGFTVSPILLIGSSFSNVNKQGFTGRTHYLFPFPRTGTISSCPIVSIPNGSQGYSGVYYGAYVSNKLTISFSVDFSFVNNNASGSPNSSYISGVYTAIASAYAGNQIIGLTGSMASICAPVNSTGASTLNLGVANFYSRFGERIINSYGGRKYYRESIYGMIIGTLTDHVPVLCTVAAPIPSAFPSLFMYYLIAIPGTSSTAGPIETLAIVIPFNNVNITTFNGNNTEYIGIKFQGPDQNGDGNPDHYLGWAEIFIHPDSKITCLGTGYNSCSIEVSLATGGTGTCPSSSNIDSGMADPMNNCVPSASMVMLSGTAAPGLDQESSDWIQSTQTLPGNTSIDYDAVQYVELKNGFCAPANANFAAFIDMCDNGGGGFNINNGEDDTK